MPKLTPEQNEQFFITRLDPFKLRHSKGMEYRSCCPIHGGTNPTQFWVDIAEGNWRCWTCGAKGGSAFTLEQAMLKAERNLSQAPSHDEVELSLQAVLGTPFVQRVYPEAIASPRTGWNRKHASAFYRYTDEQGDELFTVWRFVDQAGAKKTPADRPCPCRLNPDAECALGCDGGRVWSTKGVRRVLYRLPDVLQSLLVFVVEGEKNADDLQRALSKYIREHGGFPLTGELTLVHVAVTTNPGGASAWKPEHGFGPYFHGKTVIKLGDNDAPGRMHDEAACKDIAPHARNLFTLELPVGESEDISDYLASHTVDEFLKLLPNRKVWKQPARPDPVISDKLEPRQLLVKPSALSANSAGRERDWLIPGLISRDARGLIVAPPKTGKSLLFMEVALCLATNTSFLGLRPYGRPVRCAVISREDGPELVIQRIRQLAASKGLTADEVDHNLRINTEQQSPRFKIDQEADLVEMAKWLKAERIEFAVVDVLNRLHSKEVNSSKEMSDVMQAFDRLRDLSGCQICVIHHTNKSGGTLGSTSIEGWADYVMRLEQSADNPEVKVMHLRTKMSGAIAPKSLRYWQSEDHSRSRIEIVAQYQSSPRSAPYSNRVAIQ